MSCTERHRSTYDTRLLLSVSNLPCAYEDVPVITAFRRWRRHRTVLNQQAKVGICTRTKRTESWI